MIVRAVAYTTDYSHTSKFDASAWFASVTPERILDLVKNQWSAPSSDLLARDLAATGNYPDLAVVISQIDGGAKLFNGDPSKLETFVDADDALKLLQWTRPDVLRQIEAIHGNDANAMYFGKLFWDAPHHAFSAGYEGPHGTGPRPWPTTSLATPGDRELYLQGSCHVFATALHRRYGMSFLVVGDSDQPYWTDEADADNFIPSVVHCYGVDAEGRAWDVLGSRPASDVVKELKERHGDLENTDEDEFFREDGLTTYVDGRGDTTVDRPLHSFTDADVAEADARIMKILDFMMPAQSVTPGPSPTP